MIANMVAIERNSLDQSDPSDVLWRIASICVAAVADSQGMINGKMKTIYESPNCLQVRHMNAARRLCNSYHLPVLSCRCIR